MKKNVLLILVVLTGSSLFAQVPQGFNYQAVARNSDGTPLASVTLSVKIGILNGTQLLWQEEHSAETSPLGHFSLIVGDENASKTGGSATSFSAVPWETENLSMEISINPGNGYIALDKVPFQSVPYSLYSQKALNDGDISATNEIQDLRYIKGKLILSMDPTPDSINMVTLINPDHSWSTNMDTLYTSYSVGIGTSEVNNSLLAIQSSDPQVEKPLFEVRNDAGIPVFAVFNDGVMVYVDESRKGEKGGFAVGGYNKLSKGVSQEYLRITPDSVRIWIPEVQQSKVGKGGFAVGGYNTSKSETVNFLEVTNENTSIYFDTTSQKKGFKGGFAVGGYNTSKSGEANQLMSLTSSNYLIGQDAGINITTGRNNTFFGWESGLQNTEGKENIFIGRLSGYSTTTGNGNIYMGNESGLNSTTGYGNIYLGHQSGYYSIDGVYNSAIGYQAGMFTETDYNTFIGYQAGGNNTLGENNIAIGFRSGIGYPFEGEGITGSDNVFIGNNSGAYTTTGSKNIMVGDSAGFYNTIGYNNIFVGKGAGFSNNEGDYNIFLGYRSGASHETGISNIYIGDEAGSLNDGSSNQVFIGDWAGAFSSAGDNNIFLGGQAGIYADVGDYNSFIGSFSGSYSTGERNTFLGTYSGFYAKGNDNAIVGYEAGAGSEESYFSENTFLGSYSGRNNATGAQNVYLGYAAGYSNTSGNGNIFIGSNAGYWETGSDKLYISNSSTETPLVYGDFATSEFKISGNAGINYSGTGGYGLIVANPEDQIYYYAVAAIGDYYAEGGYYQASDKAFKKNIRSVDNAVSKVQQLNGVYFDYDLIKSGSGNNEKPSVGIIAQEVEEVFPELVKENKEGLKGVNYSGLIPVLIEAIKEQQLQIEAQQREIDALKESLGL